MLFKFENGEVIECKDETIIKLLQADKRYEEVKPKAKKEKKEVVEDKPLQ